MFPGKEPFGYFVAKVDIAKVEMEKLQQALPTLERMLEPRGKLIFQIDFTQDFSGTLDRKALVEHLHKSWSFAFQGYVFPKARGTILDNTANVGEHVCTWMQIENGYTTRVKLCNKIVSQFEVGEVQDPFWGHLTDYVCSTDKQLRKKEVVPVIAEGLIQNTLEEVSPEEGGFFLWYSRRKGNGRTLDGSWTAVSFSQIESRERTTWLGESTPPQVKCRG